MGPGGSLIRQTGIIFSSYVKKSSKGSEKAKKFGFSDHF